MGNPGLYYDLLKNADHTAQTPADILLVSA